MKRVCFSCWSSSVGSPGKSRSPAMVHFSINSSPQNASLAIFTASVPTLLLQCSLGYFIRTSFTVTSLSLIIMEEGSTLLFAFMYTGRACLYRVTRPSFNGGWDMCRWYVRTPLKNLDTCRHHHHDNLFQDEIYDVESITNDVVWGAFPRWSVVFYAINESLCRMRWWWRNVRWQVFVEKEKLFCTLYSSEYDDR